MADNLPSVLWTV